MTGQYQKILYDIFDVLEFPEEDRNHALESIKKKFANDFLASMQGELPIEQQKWLEQNIKTANPSDPKVVEIQDTIQNMHSLDELHEMSNKVFKETLKNYVDFMSKSLSHEKQAQLNEIIASF